MSIATQRLILALPALLWPWLTISAIAQTGATINEQTLRLRFVSECMGASSDTSTLSFCNCSFSKLIARYGFKSVLQQDAIVRASNAKDLVQLARLAWEPEFRSCRTP
jgi:hypothetical protein